MSTQAVSRTEQKRATRAAIVEAAAELFAHRGFDATSLDVIAERAGVTKGAVYASFASKQALIDVVSSSYSVPADWSPLFRVDLPLAERVRLFGRNIVKLLKGTARLQILLDFEYQVYMKRNRAAGAAVRNGVHRKLRKLAVRFDAVNRARGEVLPIEPEPFLYAILTVARGVLWQLAVDPSADVAENVETVLVLLASEP